MAAEDDDTLRRYLESVDDQPHLSEVEERRLAALAADGDKAAARLLVEANLRLVVRMARRYEAAGLPLLDLIQEGNLGLVQAVERFDPSRGFRFSAFAIWWIREAINRGIATTGGAVTVSHVAEVELVQQAWDALVARTGRQPAVEELAAAVGLSTDALVDLLGTPPPA